MLNKKLWYQIPLFILTVCTAVLLMVVSASYLYLGPSLPSASELKETTLQTPLRIYSDDGELIGEFGEQRRIPIEYEDIPQSYIDALVAAEDDGFFEHNGVDFKGLARAGVELMRYRTIRSGGSTITMQVARNFFLNHDQTFLRKFNEIILAMQIESLLTKEEILTLYVNKIYLGHRSYGIAAAAYVYYGKLLSELNTAEAAMLAGLPKAPSAYNPISNPTRALERRNWILGRMLKLGKIDQTEHDKAVNTEDNAEHHSSKIAGGGEYIAEMARQFAVNMYGTDAYTQGLEVHTTLDSEMQAAAARSVHAQLHDYDERHGWRGAVSKIDIADLPDADLLPSYQPLVSTDVDDDTAETNSSKASSKDDAKEARQAWKDKLKDLSPVANLEPVVITQVNNQSAVAVMRSGNTINIPWKHIKWARPYINTNSIGKEPSNANDVVSTGDMVYVRPIYKDDQTEWRLAQIPQAQGSLVSVEPTTGSIKALQGGYSYSQSNYNRAMQAERQPGSSFKPFIYSIAMMHGITPATIINDAPIVFQSQGKSWRPTGDSQRFYGPTPVREALYRSLNLVSIRLLLETGISTTLSDLSRFGFRPEHFPRELALALGSGTTTPIEMALGFSVFANGGYYLKPRFITEITTNTKKTLWKAPETLLCNKEDDCQNNREELLAHQQGNADDLSEPKPMLIEQAIDERNAWLMDSMLKDVIKKGTGSKALSLNREDIAGKTGSTNDHTDAWFVGYTPALSTAVWIGFDQPSSLGRGEYGGQVALPAWINFMGEALKGIPDSPLPQPSGIKTVRINPENGLRARSGTANTVREYFSEDNVPPYEEEQYISPYEGDEEQSSVEDLF